MKAFLLGSCAAGALALAAGLAARPAGAETPDAKAVLARVERAYTASPSFTAAFVQTYAPAGFPPAAPETGRVTLQAPDQVRFDYDGPEGKLFTFDGKAARQYVAADRQMIVKTLPASDRERLPLLFFESSGTVLSRYEAAAAGGEGGLTDVSLTPKTGGDTARIVLSVAPSGEVRRLVVTDGAGNRTTFSFTQTAAGPRRPPSDFALRPPAGTKVVSE